MRLRAVFLAPLLMLAFGCASTDIDNPASPRLIGSLALSGPTFGEQTLKPNECTSGEHQLFMGADFAGGESEPVVRIVLDPLTGPALRIYDPRSPITRSTLFRKAECKTFLLSLQRTGWRINDVYALSVDAEIDCTSPAGDSVKGSLASSSCY